LEYSPKRRVVRSLKVSKDNPDNIHRRIPMASVEGVSGSRGSVEAGRTQEVRARRQEESRAREAAKKREEARNSAEEKGSRVDVNA
jgi:hypothetical protein